MLEITGEDIPAEFASASFDETVSPCLNALPMGFNWSFYLVQQLHEQQVAKATHAGRESLIVDGRPAPSFDNEAGVSMPYCDNVHSLSTDPLTCNQNCDNMCDQLRGIGFEIHEESSASSLMPTLGGKIDGISGHVRPTPMRMWSLRRIFLQLARAAKLSSDMVQRLGGMPCLFVF